MICDRWQEKLDAYVDDNCLTEELPGLEEHLRECSSCSAEVLSRLQLKRATRVAAARYAPSPDFRLRIEKAIQTRRRPAWSLAWKPALAAFALAILLLAIPTGLWLRHAAQEQAAAELLDLHVATMASANPVDVVSTDRHTVKPWFQGKLPFTFNLPELADSQFKLLGGKLIYFRHNPGAQLLFELRKHELSVFIVQQSQGPPTPRLNLAATREKGFSVENWDQDGLHYVILSDTSPADVHRLADLIRTAANQ